MKNYYIYIMTNKSNSVLYIGVTNNLVRRVYEHKNDFVEGFTKRYKCHKLVWYQETTDVYSAIYQEKLMKKWKRQYKINAILRINPQWRDLYDEILL